MPSLLIVMGELIDLNHHRRARETARRAGVVFSFDLASPYTYLAAERVDRMFSNVEWSCVIADPHAPAHDALEAEQRAIHLRMPLVWPEGEVAAAVAAPRVASFAASIGRGAEFVLAASRLAFCGGFDLADPEILAEAAAAAGLPLSKCLAAAADASLDEAMQAEGRALVRAGATCLPVLQVGHRMFCGEGRIAEAVAASRSTAQVAAFNPA